MNIPTTSTRTPIPVEVFPSAQEACDAVADSIAELIRTRAAAGKQAVLGLATGSTPLRLYQSLIRLHKEQGLSFRNVTTFNLDEYHGLPPQHLQSYHHFMQTHLFAHIDIPREQTHIPSGIVAEQDAVAACQRYEAQIREAGGIDLQLLGIGRTGHIGFNEPGSALTSRTRLVELNAVTRTDAAPAFGGIEQVPTHAITMGVATILEARQLFLLAWGQSKAEILARAMHTPPTTEIPATFLQNHPNVRFCVDAAAAACLTEDKSPPRE